MNIHEATGNVFCLSSRDDVHEYICFCSMHETVCVVHTCVYNCVHLDGYNVCVGICVSVTMCVCICLCVIV